MGPLYVALVWLTVATHFAFLVYLPVGGFLALRWRRTIWLHFLAVLWGIASVVLHVDCPLTTIERWARARAGLPSLPSEGFIDHYITGVIYPAHSAGFVQATVLAAVVASWIAYAMTYRSGPGTRPD